MPDNDSNLPPGFVVQGTEPSPTSGIPASGLPPGFVIQNQTAPTTQTIPTPSSLPSGFEVQNSPNNGQPEPTQHLYQDSSQPFYKRAFDWANTPLTESLFGLPEDRPGAGGFERGIEHIASGLTSPLSVALTAATLGTGGFIESAGASALREAGLTAAEIADVSKGSQVAINAAKELPEGSTAITDAVKEAGVDPELWKRGQSILYDKGLAESDLLGGNALERGAFHVLRSIDKTMPVSTAAFAAKTANAVMNAGFTLQQLESASAMAPRFLDALKSGDTDKALEYGTEFLASGGLGVLGASHAIHSWGKLAEPVLSTKLRPSDTNVALQRTFGDKEAEHVVAEQTGINIDETANKLLGHEPPNPVFGDKPEVAAKKASERATAVLDVLTGAGEKGSKETASHWFNALSEARGEEERLPTTEKLNNEQLPQQIETNVFKDKPKEYQDQVLDSLKAIATDTVPNNVRAAAKYLRSEEAKTAEIGGQTGLLTNFIENHQTRYWEKENPEGRVVNTLAKTGNFATSVAAARHQVYDSTLTGLLKSTTKMIFDPVGATAKGRVDLLKAAANKKWLGTIMDNGIKDSTGRPAAFLQGSGRVVAGPNGEDPRLYIKPTNPNFRSLKISEPEVAKMTESGDLQRFLDDGTVKDRTPYVRPDNIGAAIAKLEEQSQSKEPQYDEVGNNKLSTDLMFLKSMRDNGDFSGLKTFNAQQPKLYVWDGQNYIALAKDAVKGWNFVTNSPDGTPVYVNTDVMVSPEIADYVKNRLGIEQGAISKTPLGRSALGAGSALKETLLGLSPFHLTQIMLRAVMTGSNPFTLHGPDILDGAKIDPDDPNSETKLHAMARNNLTFGTNYEGQQNYTEGVSSGDGGLLRKIPGVGNFVANSQGWWTDFLFKRALPAIKATAAEKMFDDYRAAHPDWSVDRVSKAAAEHANDSFGGVNYKALGRSATTQEFARALLLAPDWLEAELRSGARLFNKDEGGIGRGQVLKMAGGMYLLARVLNKVTTGNYHPEAPFSLATKSKDGKETLWSIRTLPTDLLHLASSPVDFVKGRLSPTFHIAQELATQRDNFGRKMMPADLWADVIRQALPIPVQDIGQAVTNTGPEVGNLGQGWKALGGTATSYSTPGEQLAAQLAANHNEDGPIDPVQMARHRTIMEIEDKVRSGQIAWPDIYKMYASGQLHQDELKKITENTKRTKDMDPALASLYTRASRLPGPEFLQLYDSLNSSERSALVPLTLQVRKRYIAKAMKNLRPEERLKDPTFMRFLNMTTDQSPF